MWLKAKKWEIYLSSSNPDKWPSPQRSHKVEYAYSFWWKNHERKQYTDKVKLLKQTTPKNWIFMPFLDTNSHLITKPYKFDIKCHINSESYERYGYFGTQLRGVRIFLLFLRWVFFNKREYSEADWLVPLILFLGEQTRSL